MVGSTTRDFVYDGLNLVQEKQNTTVKANVLTGLGLDEVFTRIEGSTTRHLLADALGSTPALTDPAGAVQTSYTYAPFGSTTSTGQTSTNPFKFTGREDDGTGLYYYRARYYHPTLSRFLTEDPIGFAGGDVNLYGYVGDNPLGYLDPLGLEWQAVIGVSGSFGGSPFLVGGLFGGGGTSIIFTSSGQIGLQFTATASAGVGLYAGVGVQAGGGYSRCRTQPGLSVSRVGQGDLNAGWGPGNRGVSVQYDPSAAGAQIQGGVGRADVGYGIQASAGVSQIVTIATPPLFGRKPISGCP